MAANRFTIPQFDIDLLNWSNNVNARNDARARQRQQDWNNVYSQAAALGNRIRAEKEAEKSRQNAAEQAALQRQFQAQEAEKSRQFQAAQNAANRKAQQDYNSTLKAMEEAKQRRAAFDKAQSEYSSLLQEPDSVSRNLRMEQIRNEYPEVDQYKTGSTVPTPFKNAGQQEVHSLAADVAAERERAAAEEKLAAQKENEYQFDLAKIRAGLPKKYKDNKAREAALKPILENPNIRQEDKNELYKEVYNIAPTTQKVSTAIENATVQHAQNKATEKINETDNKNKAMGYVGKKMYKLTFNKIPEEQRKYLSLQADGTVVEKK